MSGQLRIRRRCPYAGQAPSPPHVPTCSNQSGRVPDQRSVRPSDRLEDRGFASFRCAARVLRLRADEKLVFDVCSVLCSG